MNKRLPENLNKHDYIFIAFIIILASSLLFYTVSLTKGSAAQADVYYKKDLILTIDLSKKELQKFSVDGTLGKVYIEAKDGKVRVSEEISPLHVCSIQGWSDSQFNPLVCLPNDIIVKISSKESSDLDTVIQ